MKVCIVLMTFACVYAQTKRNSAGSGWNLLTKDACMEGQGDRPASVQINQNGFLAAVKLVYSSGLVKCNNGFKGSNFGCFNEQHLFNLAICDNNRAVLFPPPNQEISFVDGYRNYRYAGYLPTDKEVVFSNYNYPTYFNKGDYINIWNYEDLLNNAEGDNSGKVCYNVYGLFV